MQLPFCCFAFYQKVVLIQAAYIRISKIHYATLFPDTILNGATVSPTPHFRASGILLPIVRNQRTAGTAHSIRWLAMRWTAKRSEFDSRQEQDFSPLHVVQTVSGAYPASYLMGFPRGWSGRGVKLTTHSPTSTEVKNTWIYTSTSPYAFMT
jgi:hypothetical protein